MPSLKEINAKRHDELFQKFSVFAESVEPRYKRDQRTQEQATPSHQRNDVMETSNKLSTNSDGKEELVDPFAAFSSHACHVDPQAGVQVEKNKKGARGDSSSHNFVTLTSFIRRCEEAKERHTENANGEEGATRVKFYFPLETRIAVQTQSDVFHVAAEYVPEVTMVTQQQQPLIGGGGTASKHSTRSTARDRGSDSDEDDDDDEEEEEEEEEEDVDTSLTLTTPLYRTLAELYCAMSNNEVLSNGGWTTGLPFPICVKRMHKCQLTSDDAMAARREKDALCAIAAEYWTQCGGNNNPEGASLSHQQSSVSFVADALHEIAQSAHVASGATGTGIPWPLAALPFAIHTGQSLDDLIVVQDFKKAAPLNKLFFEFPTLSEQLAQSVAYQLSEALIQLHHLGITHRDVKLTNVLLGDDGKAFLVDYGCSYRFKTPSNSPTSGAVEQNMCEGGGIGTRHVRAPEVELAGRGGKHAPYACDWWSLGTVLFEILNGKPPKSFDIGSRQFVELRGGRCVAGERPNVLNGMRDSLTGKPFSPECCDFVTSLLCPGIADRLKGEAALDHPFLALYRAADTDTSCASTHQAPTSGGGNDEKVEAKKDITGPMSERLQELVWKAVAPYSEEVEMQLLGL